MRLLNLLWRKLTPSKAVELSGPLEKKFFERVYRLAFITGLSNFDDSVTYKLYSGFIYVVSILVILLEIWHACSDNLNLDEMISAVNVIIIHIITCWKLVIMLSNKGMYKKLSKALESPYFDTSTPKRKQYIEYWANTHAKYLTILLTMSFGTLAAWYTYPLIDDVEYNLVTEVHLPFDYNSRYRYVITYLVIGIMFNTASCLVVMSEVIMQAYLLPLVCQYTILADCFENIFEDCAKDFPGVYEHELVKNDLFIEAYKQRLGNLIDQHLMILNQTTDLKKVLSAPMLGQLCGSGMLICFVGYQAKAAMTENPGKFMMSVGYLMYNMFTLYLLCRWCEEITSQSRRIGEAAYCSGWANGMSLVPGVKATVMLVIVRANKPLVFLAGGMYTLNLSSYTNLVKASYSALNILLRVSND